MGGRSNIVRYKSKLGLSQRVSQTGMWRRERKWHGRGEWSIGACADRSLVIIIIIIIIIILRGRLQTVLARL